MVNGQKEITIAPGLTLNFLVIRFNTGWEFDCPVVVLEPVLRFYEDGRSIEHAIEDVLIDACVDGKLKRENENIRRWNLKYLRRKALACLKGQKFPIAWAQAGREQATFCLNADGNLTVEGWGDEA